MIPVLFPDGVRICYNYCLIDPPSPSLAKLFHLQYDGSDCWCQCRWSYSWGGGECLWYHHSSIIQDTWLCFYHIILTYSMNSLTFRWWPIVPLRWTAVTTSKLYEGGGKRIFLPRLVIYFLWFKIVWWKVEFSPILQVSKQNNYHLVGLAHLYQILFRFIIIIHFSSS